MCCGPLAFVDSCTRCLIGAQPQDCLFAKRIFFLQHYSFVLSAKSIPNVASLHIAIYRRQ